MEFGPWQRIQQLNVIPLSTPWFEFINLFYLYGQWFLRYQAISKFAIFGHETWLLAKVLEVTHMFSLSTQGVKI